MHSKVFGIESCVIKSRAERERLGLKYDKLELLFHIQLSHSLINEGNRSSSCRSNRWSLGGNPCVGKV